MNRQDVWQNDFFPQFKRRMNSFPQVSFEIHTDDDDTKCSVCSSWNCLVLAGRNLTSKRCKMGEAGLPTRGRGGVGYILSGNMILAVASRDERHFFLLFFQSEGGGSLSEYPGLDVCCVDHHPSLAGPKLVPGQLRPANKSRLAPQKSLDLFKTPIIFRLSCKSACLAGAWVLIVSL